MPAQYRVLVTAAGQTLAARALALVEGAVPSADAPLAAGTVSRSPRFGAMEAAALRDLAARRDRLRAAGEVYLAADTNVRFLAARAAGDRLELAVAEVTTLYRKRIRGDEPEHTSYQAIRTFTFIRDNGGWVLTDQSLVGDGPPPLTEPDPAGDPGYMPLTPAGGIAEID